MSIFYFFRQMHRDATVNISLVGLKAAVLKAEVLLLSRLPSNQCGQICEKEHHTRLRHFFEVTALALKCCLR